MSQFEQKNGDPFALAAFAVPFLVYILSASPHAYWLDSSEFVAATESLGISHPPGHPLWGLVTWFCNFVPVGSLSFRIAVACGLFASIGIYFLYHAAQTLYFRVIPEPSLCRPLALASAWLTASSYAWWFQAVRPEVYALQGMLLAYILLQATELDLRGVQNDIRPLYKAAFTFGLALCNHHFLVFLLLPIVALILGEVVRERSPKEIVRLASFGLAGFAAYLYLPMRAAADPNLNLGEPTTFQRFFWVVSAQAFQKNQGSGVPGTFIERSIDVFRAFFEFSPIALIVLSLIATYLILRTPSIRRGGRIWIMTIVIYSLARAWLGFVTGNPDAFGYLMPAFAALSILAGMVPAVLTSLLNLRKRLPKTLAYVIVFSALLFAGWTFSQNTQTNALAHFRDTDAFDDAIRRDLPPNAVVIAHMPETIFRYWGGEAEEKIREDITFIPTPLLSYPGMFDRLISEAPELKELLSHYLLSQTFSPEALQSLSAKRPVLLELDVRISPSLYPNLIPNGYFYEVSSGQASKTDIRYGLRSKHATWDKLDRFSVSDDPQTQNNIIWHRYLDALYFAAMGFRKDAMKSIDKGLEVNPLARELIMLRKVVERTDRRPIDVRPFLVGAQK